MPETILNTLALLSRTFRGPDEDLCREMMSQPFYKELTELKAFLGPKSEKNINLVIEYPASFPSLSKLIQDLETQYVQLFINAPGGVKAPLYQSCYLSESGLLMGHPAQRMAERQKTAGLHQDTQSGEPPDHLSTEIDFLYLALESAFTEGNSEVLQIAQKFAKEELLPFAQTINARLATETHSPFYPAAAGLLANLLEFIETI